MRLRTVKPPFKFMGCCGITPDLPYIMAAGDGSPGLSDRRGFVIYPILSERHVSLRPHTGTCAQVRDAACHSRYSGGHLRHRAVARADLRPNLRNENGRPHSHRAQIKGLSHGAEQTLVVTYSDS